VLRHLALAVSDEETSRRFYERHLGFDAREPTRYPDGVLMLYDGRGSGLALGPRTTSEDAPLPAFLHFGYVVDSPEAARAAIVRFEADSIPLLEHYDLPDYVSCKVADPDGYVVEVFWEEGF
jgi:catechol 2,3-dioxygenase-like lactoylglutathione lyase family enzyme